MVDVRIVELARRHGRIDVVADELAFAAKSQENPTPDVLDRLTKAGREALKWLKHNAVPDGWKLIEADLVIVLDRVA